MSKNEAEAKYDANFHCMQMSLVMSIRFIIGDDWNGALYVCWSIAFRRKRFRLLDRRLKKAWKTKAKEILFPVGSHVVSEAKSSKASEFKFPWIEESMFYGRFTLLYVFNW